MRKKFLKLTLSALVLCSFEMSVAQETSTEAKKPGLPAENKEPEYILCKIRSTVRTVRIEKENGICKTTYTKEGVDQVVGQGQNEQTCYNILNNIRENLEKAAWKCKDISQARISSSEE